MSGGRRAEKREVLPDPKYGDLVVSKFTNNVMYHGVLQRRFRRPLKTMNFGDILSVLWFYTSAMI